MFILGPTTREQDFSLYVAGVSKTVVGIVGLSTKGEIGQPTFCSNQGDFVAKFGSEDPNCLAVYAALQYLEEGNQLWFSRVAGQSAKKSQATVANTEATPVDAITFSGKTPGTGFDGVKVVVSNAVDNTFDVTVVDLTGRAIERHVGLSTDATSPRFLDTVLSEKSKEIDGEYLLAAPSTVATGEFTLAGGDNGVTDLTSGDIIGSASEKVGLETFKNVTAFDINILVAPGFSAPEVIEAGYHVAEERGDCLFVGDTPQGLTDQEVVDWHNGSGTFSESHQAFNSSYGALYWSWQEIYDAKNDKRVWVPPSGLVAAAMAYNDRVSEVWFAPAGLKRGRLTSVLRSEHNPDPGQQALLYGNGNNINPIIKHPKAGIAIYGQKTLQRMPSATDRINVRRLLLFLRKVIAGTAAYLAFDPNDRVTWNEFEDLIEPVLRGVKVKRGLYEYRIQMDATVVTAEEIDNLRMPGKIFVKPTKAAEAIPIDFVITRTGAEFLEYMSY